MKYKHNKIGFIDFSQKRNINKNNCYRSLNQFDSSIIFLIIPMNIMLIILKKKCIVQLDFRLGKIHNSKISYEF